MKFSDHVPEVLEENLNVRNFLAVLDGANEYKSNEVFFSLHKAFYPLFQDNVQYLRKFLFEVGQIENIQGMPRVILENLIQNANTIFSSKGTLVGFKLFMRCLTLGDCSVNFSNYWGDKVYLHPNRFELLGMLPNGASLIVADSFPSKYPFLFGGQDFDAYKGSVAIKLISPYFHVKEFRNFVKSIICNYLPMISPEYTELNIGMYGHGYNYSELEIYLYNY